MLAREIKIFKFLVILNCIASIAITHQIILYNLEYLDYKIYLILFYAFIWFFSLYKIFYFSNKSVIFQPYEENFNNNSSLVVFWKLKR